ncbi:MAG: hypothetical protein FWG81_08915 [Betaproteobacteria bacterium]|nr:hypothetical protein [Betaproteobacteria bacterium]
MKPHKPFDRNGKTIRVGDVVRIVGVPDLSGMSQDGITESLPVFQYLVGKYKRVRAFDECGCAKFSFIMHNTNGKRGWHSVWVEPFLLHVPQRRSNLAAKPDDRRVQSGRLAASR